MADSKVLAEAKRAISSAEKHEAYEDQAYPHASIRYAKAQALVMVEIAEVLGHILTTLENIESGIRADP